MAATRPRGLRLAIRILGCAAALACLFPAAASAAAPPAANPCAAGPVTTPLVVWTRLGVVDLHFFDARGAADFFECVGDRAVALGRRSPDSGPLTSMFAATSWLCGRRSRLFVATATAPDGSHLRGSGRVHTRSCVSRFELTAPARVAHGGVARVGIRDRWHVGGVRTKLCITRPAGRPGCREVVFRGGVGLATRRFRTRGRGLWRVELRVGVHSRRALIAVGVRAPARTSPPTLLATGDSTMDVLAGFLNDQLDAAANVVSDVKLGLAISKDDAFAPLAVQQVKRLRPATTVVSIGANEGWSMRAADGEMHECCDPLWVDEYARRVRRTMLTYGKRVFWCMIVAPKDPRRAPIAAAANAGVLQAAQGLPDVHVVRLDLLFSPSGYRETIRYRGRDVDVREPDGVHLNIAGAEIAAREVVEALRAVP